MQPIMWSTYRYVNRDTSTIKSDNYVAYLQLEKCNLRYKVADFQLQYKNNQKISLLLTFRYDFVISAYFFVVFNMFLNKWTKIETIVIFDYQPWHL